MNQDVQIKQNIDREIQFLDTAGNFLLGERLGILSRDHSKKSSTDAWKFVNALHATQFWIGVRVVFGLAASYTLNPWWKVHRQTVHKFIGHYVDIAFKNQQSASQSDSGKTHKLTDTRRSQSLLQTLMQQTQDKDEARNQVIQALLALQNKTSTLISNTIFLLSRNPDIWNRLRQDMNHLSIKTATAKDLREIIILQNIFKEGMYEIL